MKTFSKFYYFWLDIRLCLIELKRCVWNAGLKLQWNKLWIRKNEFHSSLDLDGEALAGMSQKRQDVYIKNLVKRRQIAHERDLSLTS